jgi:hypothetical protein
VKKSPFKHQHLASRLLRRSSWRVDVVFLFLVFTEGYSMWMAMLWFLCALLWFAWPAVIALHPAQSAVRVLVPLGVAMPFVFLWWGFFKTEIGPYVLGLPFGVWASPIGLVEFGGSYVAGWGRGKMDARQGRLVLEGYGFGFEAPRAPIFSDETAKRLGITVFASVRLLNK